MKRERFETDYIYTNVPHVFYDSTLAFRTPSMLEETAMAIHFSHLSQHRKTENLNDDYMAELNNKYLAMSIASLFAADTAATVAI